VEKQKRNPPETFLECKRLGKITEENRMSLPLSYQKMLHT
jgi:hypothetical protein